MHRLVNEEDGTKMVCGIVSPLLSQVHTQTPEYAENPPSTACDKAAHVFIQEQQQSAQQVLGFA